MRGGVGGRLQREGIYVYTKLIHVYSINWHNIVKQLSSSLKKKKAVCTEIPEILVN